MTTTFPGAALVTGAAGGIGAATAIAFAKAGCTRIAITDIQPAALDKTRDDILSKSKNKDINVLAISGDITSEPFIETLITSAFNTLGRLDYVVNCAGVLQNDFARSTDVSTQQFDFINGVNYRGTWLVSRAALRRMLTQTPLKEEEDGGESWRPGQRGSIVNVASQLGVVSRAGAAAYCASKAAVIGLTRADAIDFSKDLIRVNCVCPGVIDTNMTTSSPERVEAMAPAVKIAPMGRMGDPREVADAVLFLSSSRASFVQGHALVVDGGYVIN
ncbi:hypothetical protein ASPVEDRAFT_45053 [Aspergillus versicolor CBS 583.65]|uniref:Uncharacterized protein n=1 Tax=Aspergillus versicolor CBS 583.65 TaxID=1036611 RepID=A0A1L9PVM2_ASPVE|nr:uncharacterized protein ASPVEDRAFT_45053 [Aspergillus versicolor CBS 583.65]OJJ05523.1 hypothetical protein ASPVEDRAFT_45053 [Aspergillus versicolor CBS 583.65]